MQIKNNKRYSNNKGITLTSLVITIVVLIILTGVTLSVTVGENGSFKRSRYAREQYLNTEVAEQERLNKLYSEQSSDENISKGIIESGIWRAK